MQIIWLVHPLRLRSFVFFVSLYLVAFSQGGYKPCTQGFGANQFDEEDELEHKAKSSFFNWSVFAMNGGLLVAILVLDYIQENVNWELGFGIPCIRMFFALVIFLLRAKTYKFRVKKDERNPFVRIGNVFLRAAKNWNAAPTCIFVERKEQGILPHESTKFKNVCTIDDVNDAKAILRLAPIWCSCLGYAIVLSQPSTLFTKQVTMMDRHIGYGFKIPAASMRSLTCISLMLFVPIYDFVLLPMARSITKKPTGISMLQQIGAWKQLEEPTEKYPYLFVGALICLQCMCFSSSSRVKEQMSKYTEMKCKSSEQLICAGVQVACVYGFVEVTAC
ncbi:hypothetical protein ACS0TY_013281 [Phlomoides rotata]